MNNSTETEGFPSGIGALKKEILSALHCALPGIVEAFDPETQTAAVRPALKRRTGSGPGKDACALPLLRDVPVFMPVPFEVNPGDACLLVFADCDIDAWLETGEAEIPRSGRQHSLSDAFAFIGFKPRFTSTPEAAADHSL